VRQSWAAAYEQLGTADRESPLASEDLERLAKAAFLTGRETEAIEILTRAHQAFLTIGDAPGAARCGFWIGQTLMSNGEMAPAAGWYGRTERLLDERGLDCVERGYLKIPVALRFLLAMQDNTSAYRVSMT
jgi:hypothetical protein